MMSTLFASTGTYSHATLRQNIDILFSERCKAPHLSIPVDSWLAVDSILFKTLVGTWEKLTASAWDSLLATAIMETRKTKKKIWLNACWHSPTLLEKLNVSVYSRVCKPERNSDTLCLFKTTTDSVVGEFTEEIGLEGVRDMADFRHKVMLKYKDKGLRADPSTPVFVRHGAC